MLRLESFCLLFLIVFFINQKDPNYKYFSKNLPKSSDFLRNTNFILTKQSWEHLQNEQNYINNLFEISLKSGKFIVKIVITQEK